MTRVAMSKSWSVHSPTPTPPEREVAVGGYNGMPQWQTVITINKNKSLFKQLYFQHGCFRLLLFRGLGPAYISFQRKTRRVLSRGWRCQGNDCNIVKTNLVLALGSPSLRRRGFALIRSVLFFSGRSCGHVWVVKDLFLVVWAAFRPRIDTYRAEVQEQ